MERKEKWLKENGFKKRWIDDKSGYWFEKHFKLGEFKCRFNSDDKFNFIEIKTLSELFTKGRWDSIWEGSWTQFKKKVKKYDI